ncbi:hypothetical protein N7510_005686 [Penicillium lagena]|uniref:uncharacterized protein n=1 Tax=Penicillium lagena TaxID=94218 RepID=UPI002540641B|nr:uncharacterized protein N7510_005686 [Penicillium lagena]KAJ5612492.1 hypothetical protein N7510_005686 [Penicillium lagena]
MDEILEELAARYASLGIHDDTQMKIDNLIARYLYPRVPEHLIEWAHAYWMDFLEAISIILQMCLSQIFNDAYLRSGITEEQEERNPVVE